ncbi:Aspartate kinase FUB3 [Hyphodiscus hymeniophilus]|uniref:Aspartokinase n=1 Tax=Hyphodiscus hymeniophilus TaxID=353542 RepID=A0A9P6VEJ5_9HELO|nr:Aspartate kinase FUB3 [Hyphodiscus hymeniophilus]
MTNLTSVNGHRKVSAKASFVQAKYDNCRNWVVQKFGGTSVGKFAQAIVGDIISVSLKERRVAVICSARSTGKKDEGTTSRLLEVFSVLTAIRSEIDTESVRYESLLIQYERLVDTITEDHMSAARSHIRSQDLRFRLMKEIQDECDEIREYRVATERWRLEMDSRAKDRVISFGEKLSCRFITVLLQDRGIEAEYIDLSDLMRPKATRGISINFFQETAAAIREKILTCNDRVPILTGFFGTVPGGLIDGEIGRGYTDLCAALVAIALSAEELQIWKEVDGIFTADPSKVPAARLLSTISSSEAAELTFFGSEVIHHLTVDQVTHAIPSINIRIKNVKKPYGSGTIIVPDSTPGIGQLSRTKMHRSTNCIGKRQKRPTAITIKENICVINVHSNTRSLSHSFFFNVFSILHKRRISVDLISTSEVHVSMAIHSANVPDEQLQEAHKELDAYGNVSILHDMAIMSLVGAEMRSMNGVAGASEINISCVINEHEATRAMNIVHAEFFTLHE